MKLTFILPSMGCGGAQRVVSLLAGHWASAGWNLEILTLDAGPSFYNLPDQVRHRTLDLMADAATPLHAVSNNLKRILHLRGLLLSRKPDLTLSFLGDTNVKTLLACWRTGLRVVVSERNNPARYPMSPAWQRLRSMTYPGAAALVVQTREIQDFFPQSLQHKIHLIPNPVTPPPDLPPPGNQTQRTVLAMGRLHHQKGFDLLLRAFASLAGDFPEWTLRIHGQGDERHNLENLAQKLGIASRLQLPGLTDDAYGALAQCAVFALPSRYEGFPNALLEAMAAGRGVVAADCPTGPAELIRHNENGLLVPTEDWQALGRRLRQLMAEEELRLRLGEAARLVARDYGLEAVAARWEQVFRQAGAMLPDDPLSPGGGS